MHSIHDGLADGNKKSSADDLILQRLDKNINISLIKLNLHAKNRAELTGIVMMTIWFLAQMS